MLVLVEALGETAAQVRCQDLVEAEVEGVPVQILEYKLQEVLAHRLLVEVLVEVLAARLEDEHPVSFRVVKQADLLEVLTGLGHGLGPIVVAWGDQLQQQRLHHHLNNSSRHYNSDNNYKHQL